MRRAGGEGIGPLVTLLALAAWLAGCRSMIDGMIFFPDRDVGAAPPGASDLWLETTDGVRLHAWRAGPRTAPATLVWSHGNGGNIAGRADVLLELAARGLDVVAYDYRGYGRSDGSPTEAGVYIDAETAFDAVVASGVPASRILCFGESLGGAVSIHLATRRPCVAVAVISTFTTLRDVARVHYGPLANLVGGRFDSLSRVASLTVPLFCAHGDRDEVVPYELGERLFAAASEPKTFLAVPGAHHNDVFGSQTLLSAIVAFARKVAHD